MGLCLGRMPPLAQTPSYQKVSRQQEMENIVAHVKKNIPGSLERLKLLYGSCRQFAALQIF